MSWHLALGFFSKSDFSIRSYTRALAHQVLAVEAWVRAFKFDMVVVYTGGGLGVTYPFDACQDYAAYLSATSAHCPSPDDPTFRTIAAAYVDELTAASQRLHGSAPRFFLPPGARASRRVHYDDE